MKYICTIPWRKIMSAFGIQSLITRVVDNIINANTKQQMFMAIFSLHNKYFDVVDFDSLFLDTLDRIFIVEFYSNHCSYLDIASEIIADVRIIDDDLRNVLLNWIYNEPYFRELILVETPRADVETPPILTEATMV